MSKRVKMVTVRVPVEYAGVVAGALSFALTVAQDGWPQALAKAPDSLRCVGAVSDAARGLLDAYHVAQKKAAQT